VLLEAMSYGLDVLVSDIPASHLVKLDANDYFPRGEYKALSEMISVRLKQPRKRKYELKDYNWNTVAKETVEVYRKVIR